MASIGVLRPFPAMILVKLIAEVYDVGLWYFEFFGDGEAKLRAVI
jgi:hypothetical protein